MDLNNNWILTIPRSIFVVISICLNLLVVFLIFKFVKNPNKSYISLVLLLCVNNVGTDIGLILPVFNGLFFGRNRGFSYKFECFLTTTLTSFSSMFEHIIILFLSIDLLLAFRYPMDYLTKRYNKLPIIAAVLSFTAGIIAVFMNFVNFDFYEKVSVCAMDEINGNVGKLYSASFMFVILICNIVLWIVAFITFMKQKSNSAITMRLQHELFVVLTYLVIAYALKTAAPICFNIVSVSFTVDFEFLNIGTSLLALIVVLATTIFNASILLLKNTDINQALKKFIRKNKHKKQSIHIVSVQVQSSHI